MENLIFLNFTRKVGSFTKKFHFNDGEEYILNTIITCVRHFDVRMKLEWKNSSNAFIRANIYCDTCLPVFTKSMIIRKDRYALFPAVGLALSNSNNILIIKVIHWKDSEYSLTSVNSIDVPVPQKTTNGPVVGKEFVCLSKDLKNLLKSGYLSDIALSDGTNKIQAHKSILSARSPVFAKMFEHEMKESVENVITIKDIPIDVLKKLLDYLYAGEVEINDLEMASSLYVAGDKYDVKGLKDLCSQMLKKVDLDNILSVVVLADLYNDEQVKQAAFDFIHNNYQKVRSLASWSDFLKQNQSLAIEVLSFECDRRN